MSGCTITLSPAHMDRLRSGQHVRCDDSSGREVLLHMDGEPPDGVYNGAQVVSLAPADLDLIEADGVGAMLASTDSRTTWLVRVAA